MLRPAVAFIANLVVPPIGHLYVGAARRGILCWLAVQAAALLLLLPILLAPGPGTLLLALMAGIGLVAVLPIDGLVLARRRRSAYLPRRYGRWYVYVATGALALMVGGLFRGFARTQLQAIRIPSEGMRPTLLVGDFLFVDKVSHRVQGLRRGDLVVFPYPADPAKDFIKRLIATGGETVEMRDKRVWVDGTALDEPYAIHTDPVVRPAGDDPRDNFGPYSVPPGELFVMGDHRDNSNDSRYWGTVSERLVSGRALVIYWSWDGVEARPRWGRVGMRTR